MGPGLGELPEICGFPFNISVTAEASDFKFGTQFGFAKDDHKITTQGKSGRGLGLGKHPNIWGSPLIFPQRSHCPLSVSGASCSLWKSLETQRTFAMNTELDALLMSFHTCVILRICRLSKLFVSIASAFSCGLYTRIMYTAL